MENEYKQLCAINLEKKAPKPKPSGIGMIFLGIILLAWGIYSIVVGGYIQGIIGIVLGISAIIIRFPLHSASVKKWEANKASDEEAVKKHNAEIERVKNRKSEVLYEVRGLVNEL